MLDTVEEVLNMGTDCLYDWIANAADEDKDLAQHGGDRDSERIHISEDDPFNSLLSYYLSEQTGYHIYALYNPEDETLTTRRTYEDTTYQVFSLIEAKEGTPLAEFRYFLQRYNAAFPIRTHADGLRYRIHEIARWCEVVRFLAYRVRERAPQEAQTLQALRSDQEYAINLETTVVAMRYRYPAWQIGASYMVQVNKHGGIPWGGHANTVKGTLSIVPKLCPLATSVRWYPYDRTLDEFIMALGVSHDKITPAPVECYFPEYQVQVQVSEGGEGE